MDDELDELPAYSLAEADVSRAALTSAWPHPVTREWAWGGSTGAGVRVCIVDSGVQPDHPRVGPVQRAVAVRLDGDEAVVEADLEGDLGGHGTACAGIVRALAPDCEIVSVRVLGANITGAGRVLLAGLQWAVEEGFEVVNLSLSTRRPEFAAALHALADRAYFRRTLLVASAHNLLVDSYPWQFSSVLSVASHELAEPEAFFYNPAPPVEFFGRGVDVEVAWSGGQVARTTGNSFATPHLAGFCARVLGKHPGLTPFQLKSVLMLCADNVRTLSEEAER